MRQTTQSNSSPIRPQTIGTIHSIPVSEIIPMKNNPFQLRDDLSMNERIERVS